MRWSEGAAAVCEREDVDADDEHNEADDDKDWTEGLLDVVEGAEDEIGVWSYPNESFWNVGASADSVLMYDDDVTLV